MEGKGLPSKRPFSLPPPQKSILKFSQISNPMWYTPSMRDSTTIETIFVTQLPFADTKTIQIQSQIVL
jgi:hypothetical protein